MPVGAARSARCRASAGSAGRRVPDPQRSTRRWPGAGRCCPRSSRTRPCARYATAEVLLDRYGVVTRGAVVAEEVPGGFAGVYRVLAAAEESGRVRRGYFVEGLGASQFATTGAVDRLRAGARPVGDEPDRAVAAPSCWPPPTRPTPTARRCPGRTGRRAGTRPTPTRTATAGPTHGHRHEPAASGSPARPQGRRAGRAGRRRARALRRARRQDAAVLDRRPDSRCRRPPTRWPWPSARAPWAGSPSRRPTAARCSARTTRSAPALAKAGFHATPRGLRLRARDGGRPCLRATPSGAPRSGCDQALAGARSCSATCGSPASPTADLARRDAPLEVVSRGKHLLHRFDNGLTLHSHLRMEGQWRVEHPGRRRRAGCAATTCGPRCGTAKWTALGLRLGMLDLVADRARSRRWSATSARTCSAPTGTSSAAVANLRAIRARRSARPCSTSATWPASARSGPRDAVPVEAAPRGPPAAELDAERISHRLVERAAPAARPRPAHHAVQVEHRRSARRARRPSSTPGRAGRAGAAATRCGSR